MREVAITVGMECRFRPQRELAHMTRQGAKRTPFDRLHAKFAEHRRQRAGITEHPLTALTQGRGQGKQGKDVAKQKVVVVLVGSAPLGRQQDRADRRRHEQSSQVHVGVRGRVEIR